MTSTIDHPGDSRPGPAPRAPAIGNGRRSGPRLRVLVGTDTYPPDVNGAAHHTARLIAGLATRGHEVHVLCPSLDRRDATVTKDRITERRIASWRTPLHPSFRVCAPLGRGRATAAIQAIRPDIVHVQGHFPIGRALARAAAGAQIPVVATNHFMPDNLTGYTHLPRWLTTRLSQWAWRDATRVLGRADAVTAPTDTAVQLLHAHGLSTPAQSVSCGVDLDTFRPSDHDGLAVQFGLSDRPTIGFVGRLDTEKHLDEAITALATIRPLVDAQLVIAGVGAQRRTLETQAISQGVAEHVHFLGFVADRDLPELYAAMDVFVMPGTAELQSLATLEALACGTPVVAADAVALPHLVEPDHNGFLYPPGDTKMLAMHLVTLLTDVGIRTRMGHAARAVAERHDFAATLDQFEAIYYRMTRTTPYRSELARPANHD